MNTYIQVNGKMEPFVASNKPLLYACNALAES